jgi:hypothetical protein
MQAGANLYVLSGSTGIFVEKVDGAWQQFEHLCSTGQLRVQLHVPERQLKKQRSAEPFDEMACARSGHTRFTREVLVEVLPGPGGLESPCPHQYTLEQLPHSGESSIDEAWGQHTVRMTSEFIFENSREQLHKERKGGLCIPQSAACKEVRLAAARLKVIQLVKWQLQLQQHSPVHNIGDELLRPLQPATEQGSATTEAGVLGAATGVRKMGQAGDGAPEAAPEQ